MANLFNEILYRPLLNLLFLAYNHTLPDIGVAIVVVTIFIRLVLLPLFYKSAKDQTIIQKIAPRIKEIQQTHKNDKERQVKEMMAVYKEHKVNPFSSFLLLFIQLPILFALYRVFLGGFSDAILKELYPFVAAPAHINFSFLGIIPLDQKNIVLVILAALFQYAQSALLLRVSKKARETSPATPPAKGDMAAMTEKLSRRMMLFTPVLTAVILLPLPSAVALYWLTTSAFSTVQQVIINKRIREHDERHQTGQ